MGGNKGEKIKVFVTKAHHETIAPWWKEAAVDMNTPLWLTCRKGLEKREQGRKQAGVLRYRQALAMETT